MGFGMTETYLVFRAGPDNETEVTHVCSSYSLAAKRARGITLLWGPSGKDEWVQDGNRYFSTCFSYHVWLESFELDAGSEITNE